MIKKLFKKKIITIPFLLILLLGVYFGYNALNNKNKGTRYALAAVEKGTLIVSVSGSGQVSASNQIDVKPKISSDVAALYIKKGDEVKAGKLMMKLDTADFQKAVNDAQTSLETAKLELEKLSNPPDELTLLQAENSLAQTKESKQKAEDNIQKTYEDGFNTVSNVFLELPDIMTWLHDMLFSSNFNKTQLNINYYADAVKTYDEKVLQYKTDTYDKYQAARKTYDENFQDYKSASRFSETSVIDSLIGQTYDTVRNIAETVKSANNLIQFYQDKLTERNLKPEALSDTHLSNLAADTSKTNSQLLNLLSTQRSLEDSKEAVVNAERTIEEKELSLAKLKAGSDVLDIRAKKIAVQQKEDVLQTAKQNLANCYILSPIDGLVADVAAKKGESVSAAQVLTSVVTQQKIAEISLNEVDVAKVKVDQKVTLTFDALAEVTITGKVIDVDMLGTVSQGVVSYGVKIAFDTQDERIKPGMSVAADIITDAKQDVLLVPNNAIKSQGSAYYVELAQVPDAMKKQLLASVSGAVLPTAPETRTVEIGLANDLSTEIVSGLGEGDIVITSTVSSNSTQSTQTQGTQGFRLPRMGGQQIRD